MKDFQAKKKELHKILAGYLQEGLILALSGGVDSALLLGCIATFPEELKANFLAITFETVLYPVDEIDTAKELSQKYGINHRLVHPETEVPDDIKHNPEDRCYLCKKNLFFKVLEMAKNEGYRYIIDGTNADDLKTYRPGKKALDELGVKSPLAECGMTKAEVRQYAAELEIGIASKPSGSCYATRFPYGADLSIETIVKLAELELFIRRFKITQLRVRYHEPILRIEIMPEEFSLFIEHREEILKKSEELEFSYLTLDMAGFRSGSMDINIKK